MVIDFQLPNRIYEYPFEIVMAAYNMRFPICQRLPLLISTKISNKSISEDGSTQIIERECRTMVPEFIKLISGANYLDFRQKNTLHSRNRRLYIEVHNKSFTSSSYPGNIQFAEKTYYFAHPQLPNVTCYEQHVSLEVKSFFGFHHTIEKIATKYGHLLSQKMDKLLRDSIQELLSSGVTQMPPWADGTSDRHSTLQAKREEDGDMKPFPLSDLTNNDNVFVRP